MLWHTQKWSSPTKYSERVTSTIQSYFSYEHKQQTNTHARTQIKTMLCVQQCYQHISQRIYTQHRTIEKENAELGEEFKKNDFKLKTQSKYTGCSTSRFCSAVNMSIRNAQSTQYTTCFTCDALVSLRPTSISFVLCSVFVSFHSSSLTRLFHLTAVQCA